nr:Mariner Mos1 transposase [Hymenolepis microstoma]
MFEFKPNSRDLREVVSGDFAAEDRHSGGGEKVIEDAEWEAILSEDSCQTQELSESLGGYQIPAGAWGCSSVVERSLRMREAPGSIPGISKPMEILWGASEVTSAVLNYAF